MAKAVDGTEDASIEADATDSDADVSETRLPAREAEGLKRGDIAVLVLSPGGAFERHCTLGELLQERKGKAKDEFHEGIVAKVVVVDARLAGSKDGLLNPGSSDPVDAADTFPEWSERAGFRVRQAASRSDGEEAEWRFEDDLALRRDDEGTVQEWLVVEHFRDAARMEDARSISKPQELAQHQDLAGRKMERVARGVGLPDAAAQALVLGASLHDEGKRAARWQRAFKAARDARKHGLSLPLAKTRGPIDQAVLGGYRHELGSLIELEENAALKALPEDWRELVLHLVAAHRGQARPAIETRGCDAPPSQLEERAAPWRCALRGCRGAGGRGGWRGGRPCCARPTSRRRARTMRAATATRRTAARAHAQRRRAER